jgi:dienelactone hydrolase
VAAIKAKFQVRTGRTDWAVAGYSNGGTCAARFGTLHAPIWGSLLAIAPEEYYGSSSPAGTLRELYHGDKALFEANKIPHQKRAKTLPDTTAVVTFSTDDTFHVAGVKAVAEAAQATSMKTTLLESPTGAHGVGTLRQGLTGGVEILGKRFGLASP